MKRIRPKIVNRFDFGILKREGKIIYKTKQRIANGQMKGAILSPLPVKSFSNFTVKV